MNNKQNDYIKCINKIHQEGFTVKEWLLRDLQRKRIKAFNALKWQAGIEENIIKEILTEIDIQKNTSQDFHNKACQSIILLDKYKTISPANLTRYMTGFNHKLIQETYAKYDNPFPLQIKIIENTHNKFMFAACKLKNKENKRKTVLKIDTDFLSLTYPQRRVIIEHTFGYITRFDTLEASCVASCFENVDLYHNSKHKKYLKYKADLMTILDDVKNGPILSDILTGCGIFLKQAGSPVHNEDMKRADDVNEITQLLRTEAKSTKNSQKVFLRSRRY